MTDPATPPAAPLTAAQIAELIAALRATMPYAADSARRHERLGLAEEAAAAHAAHRRAQWALRAAGQGETPARTGIAFARDCED